MVDLRIWLDQIEKLGQLEKIDGVNGDLQLSTLA